VTMHPRRDSVIMWWNHKSLHWYLVQA